MPKPGGRLMVCVVVRLPMRVASVVSTSTGTSPAAAAICDTVRVLDWGVEGAISALGDGAGDGASVAGGDVGEATSIPAAVGDALSGLLAGAAIPALEVPPVGTGVGDAPPMSQAARSSM